MLMLCMCGLSSFSVCHEVNMVLRAESRVGGEEDVACCSDHGHDRMVLDSAPSVKSWVQTPLAGLCDVGGVCEDTSRTRSERKETGRRPILCEGVRIFLLAHETLL
jgi:hypothetical protein